MKNCRFYGISFTALILLSSILIPLASQMIFSMMASNSFMSGNFSPVNEPTAVPITGLSDPPSSFYDKDIIQQAFNPDFAPLQILTVVHQNDSSFFDELAYLSILPNAIFNDSGIFKISPIIYDCLDESTRLLLDDWRRYNNYFMEDRRGSATIRDGGLKRILYVGDVPNNVRNEIEPALNYSYIAGDELAPLNFSAENIFDLSASIADYFWFNNSKIIVAFGNESLSDGANETLSFSGTVNPFETQNILGSLDSSGSTLQQYSSSNMTIQGEFLFMRINNTQNDLFGLELIGNGSQTVASQWVFDTNNFTSNDYVFFPNVAHPANSSDWLLKVYNKTAFSGIEYYNLTFFNSSGASHQFNINNSNIRLQFSVNDSRCQVWLLDPNGQLVERSNDGGSISVEHPLKGQWNLYITSKEQETNSFSYNITVTKTNLSSIKEDVALSASNAAVIASLLHVPILYVNDSSIPSEMVQQVIEKLQPDEAIFVEPGNTINQTIFTQSLESWNLTTITALENMTSIIEFIYNLSSEHDVILSSLEDGHFAPAAFLAAYHGGVVLPCVNESNTVYQQAYQNYQLLNTTYFQYPFSGPAPLYEDMVNLSTTFESWMSNLDKANPDVKNRTVIIVSPTTDLRLTLDRAIIGLDKFIVGRFPGETGVNNSIEIQRSIFAPLFIYRELSPDYKEIYFPTNLTGEHAAGIQTSQGVPIEGTIENTYENDGSYYSWLNDSNGYIDVPFYIDLDNGTRDLNINKDNITQIWVHLKAKTNLTENVTFAGVRLWNWTNNDYDVINDSIFNSTSDQQYEVILLQNYNITDYVGNLTNQIKIDFYFNASNSTDYINASIDFVQFNISYDKGPFARQRALFSSVSYWHNLTFDNSQHNYSSEIPEILSTANYDVWNTTGYNNILDNFSVGPALWYHCGYGVKSNGNDGEMGAMNFLEGAIDYWRGFDDGKSADDPLLINPVNNSNGFFKNESEFISDSPPEGINVSIILLNDDYLAATTLPSTFMSLGTSSLIANYRENMLGYSEQVFSIFLQQAIQNNNTIGMSLALGLNSTSRVYSQNWRNDIQEESGFPDNSEDYHQFVLFGDPEQRIPSAGEELYIPGNYKVLLHDVFSYLRRKNYHIATPGSEVWANVTDIDDYIDPNNDPYTKFRIYINGTVFQPSTRYIFQTFIHNYTDTSISDDFLPENFSGREYNIVIKAPVDTLGPGFHTEDGAKLGPVRYDWLFVESLGNYDDLQAFSHNVTLISARPEVKTGGSYPDTAIHIRYNATNYTQVTNPENQHIRRINETLNVTAVIADLDDDRYRDNDDYEFNATLCLKSATMDHWINKSMDMLMDIEDYSSPYNTYWYKSQSWWNCSYNFTEYDPVGRYDIYVEVQSYDEYGESAISTALHGAKYIGYVYVDNWAPEVESFEIENTTVYRVNETFSLNTTLKDIDDFIASDVNTSLQIDGNASILETSAGIFYGRHENTFTDDSVYHYAENDSSGFVSIPYYINLTNYGFDRSGIGGIEVTVQAKISQTTNVTFAGWKIMNWTTNQPDLINGTVFNSTSDVTTTVNFTGSEITDIINNVQNNRIEIFFQLNTTNLTTNGYVDFIQIQVLNYNKTGVYAEIQLLNIEHDIWLNRTMKFVNDVGGAKYNTSNWTFSYVFTSLDRAGSWLVFLYLRDRENDALTFNTTSIITVVNHVPNIVEIYQPASSVYRTQNITFLANASDIDVFSRGANLTVNASLYCYKNSQWYNISMDFNASSNSWYLDWTPLTTYETGNWTFYVTVEDEEGGINETTTSYNFTVVNNAPIISLLQIYPPNYDFYEGMTLTMQLNFSDLEGLKEFSIQIDDNDGGLEELVNTSVTGNSSIIYYEFDEDDLADLSYNTRQWTLRIVLVDSDDETMSFVFQLTVTPRPPVIPPPYIPWEIFLIFGVIIILVAGAIMIYQFRRKEKPAIPASKVKSIIKQLSEQRKEEELREQKLIEERIEKEKKKALKSIKTVKKPKPKKKVPVETKPLSKLERKNLEIQLSDLLGDARFEVRKNNYTKAGQLYKKAARVASRLGYTEKVKRFSEQANSYLRKAKKK